MGDGERDSGGCGCLMLVAPTLNSLSSRRCGSAGDVQSLLPLRAGPTLSLAPAPVHPSHPSVLVGSRSCPDEGTRELSCHSIVAGGKWAIAQRADPLRVATLCDLSDSNCDLSPYEARAAPLNLEGFVVIPNPLYLMNPPAREI